jgi:class 3 adenylate cyclase
MTGTATFPCSDIEGSPQLLKQLGRDRYPDVRADQQRLLREVFAAHGDRVPSQEVVLSRS